MPAEEIPGPQSIAKSETIIDGAFSIELQLSPGCGFVDSLRERAHNYPTSELAGASAI